ncbi:hypothetical protein L209DRAFT_765558 [Thermothelomyces heterothallicus CBS 203.75]
MDSVEIVVVASPFANLAPLYEADPDADALLIVPPSNKTISLRSELPSHPNGIDSEQNGRGAATGVLQTGLRIKASSKHLALASRVFRNKLQFGNTRAARQSDGRIHLRLAEGFHPTAVSIVINAIHGRGSKVPRNVDLETLAHIALFVGRFQLLDAVEVYADRWISTLEHSDPDTFSRDPIPWIYISHVFRQGDIFKEATKLAAARSSGPISTLGLPIKEKIIHHIDAQRQALLARTLAPLHQAVDTLVSGAAACSSHHCDSLLLGELIKSLQGGDHPQGQEHETTTTTTTTATATGLIWPRPARPFPGLGFASVVGRVDRGLAAYGRAVEARVEAERQRRQSVEVEPWYMKKGGGGPGPSTPGRPGWGVVSDRLPVTPAASPEPVYANPRQEPGSDGGERRHHQCGTAGIVAALGELRRLGDEVEGLVLEGRLGYLQY